MKNESDIEYIKALRNGRQLQPRTLTNRPKKVQRIAKLANWLATKGKFLRNFTGNIYHTCLDVGVSESTPRKWCNADKEFKERLEEMKPDVRSADFERAIKVASSAHIKMDIEVAEIIGVSNSTLGYWKKRSPDFKRRYMKALKG
jgi:hypothetical protein